MISDQQRRAIVTASQLMLQRGLNTGAAGNISMRSADGMLITPTGIAPDALHPANIVAMQLDGRYDGQAKPSSEWLMHAAVYRERADIHSIVHCHSRSATALSCCGRGIPAFHYMIAAAGGDIRCADYALFGTEELAQNALAALVNRTACLLGNHGQLALGNSLQQALDLAFLIEELAATYHQSLAIGGVKLLDDVQMDAVVARFGNYGQQNG
jgi:L-fuculose-phosphate aldolase